MTSPHSQLVDAINDHVEPWRLAEWPDAALHPGFTVEHLYTFIEGTDPGVLIGIVPTLVIDDGEGAAENEDQDLISVALLVVAKVTASGDLKRSDVEELDTLTNRLRNHVKKLHETTVTFEPGLTEQAERRTTQYTAIFDYQQLDQLHIWSAGIETTYALPIPEGAE